MRRLILRCILSTRMNSFNFILNECGGVLARRVAAGVGLTRSDGQVVEREQGSRAAIPDISAINFSIDDNTILTNRGAVSVDKKPGRITLDFCRASSPLILFTESPNGLSSQFGSF